MNKRLQGLLRYLVFATVLGLCHTPAFTQVYADAAHTPGAAVQQGKTSVRGILFALEEAYHVSFNYDDAVLRNVTLKSRFNWSQEEPLDDILKRLTKQVALKIEKADAVNYYVLPGKKKALPAAVPPAQDTLREKPAAANPATTQAPAPRPDIVVSGVVQDDTGLPLPGVNVLVKNTSNGTTTDGEGRYTIAVPEDGAILVFSFIGFNTQEIAVNGRAAINVRMLPDIATLEEVVVVGYGEQRREEVIGSVASIKADEIEDLPVSNLGEALRTKFPGVNIATSSSRPGNTSVITIRNTGSWGSNDKPTYVINGVIMTKEDFDALDATEVESISVLKDASAAVYGVKAANGVIVVKTKQGRVGKPTIQYKGTIGVSSPRFTPKMMDSYHLANLVNDQYDIRAIAETDARRYTPDEIEYYRTHKDYDWLDAAWTNPVVKRHALNISGGTEKVRYFFGGSYWDETGAFENLSYKKYSVRGSITTDITNDLTATFTVNTDLNNNERPYVSSEQADVLDDSYRALLQIPGYRPAYINGLPSYDAAVNSSNKVWHPLEVFKKSAGYKEDEASGINALLSLEYRVPFIEGLSVKAQYNHNKRDVEAKDFRQPYTLYEFAKDGEHNHIITDEFLQTRTVSEGDYLENRYSKGSSYQFNTSVTYNRHFEKHAVNALFVYEQAESNSESFQASRIDFIRSDIDLLRAGGTVKDAYGTASETGRMSYVGRVNYGYDEKYLVEATLRADASVNFAPGKYQWGYFPSVQLGWIASEENFFKETIPFFDFFKIRVTGGILGNDQTTGYQWRETYSIDQDGPYFGSQALVLEPTRDVVNPIITWEKTKMLNTGIDTKFMDNRMNFSFDYYYKYTYDILGSRNSAVPSTVGASLPAENYGRASAQGFEVALGYTKEITHDIVLGISGNISYRRNKVIEKYESEGVRPSMSEIGHQSDRVVGYWATGIIRTQEEVDAILADNPDYTIFGKAPEPGMMNYRDIRGADNSEDPDGKIDEQDQDYIAQYSGNPYGYGINLSLSWRGLSLNMAFSGGFGGKDVVDKDAIEGTRYFDRARKDAYQKTTYTFWQDYWTAENPNARYPRAYDNQAYEPSTFWMVNGGVLFLQNANLSYTLPQNILLAGGQYKLPKVRMFLTGNNLAILHRNLKYKDPGLAKGHTYPMMRNFTFGLDITF